MNTFLKMLCVIIVTTGCAYSTEEPKKATPTSKKPDLSPLNVNSWGNPAIPAIGGQDTPPSRTPQSSPSDSYPTWKRRNQSGQPHAGATKKEE